MIRAVILFSAAIGAAAQTKAGLAPPRDIDRAARKVEQSWAAWRDASPEKKLLTVPQATALAAIDRSAALASRYVTEKKAYYGLIASALRRSADALGAQQDEAPLPEAQIEQQLARLEERQKAIREAMLNGAANDGRAAAIQQTYQTQAKALDSLTAIARRQVAELHEAAAASQDLARHRKAAAEALEQVARTVEGINATVDDEDETLALYHEHLRALVREQGRGHVPEAASHSSLSDELDALTPKPAPSKKEPRP